MKKYFTLSVLCIGAVEVYETPDNVKYQHYNKDWKYAPTYYNFIVNGKYTNLPSPIVIKYRKYLQDIMGLFYVK